MKQVALGLSLVALLWLPACAAHEAVPATVPVPAAMPRLVVHRVPPIVEADTFTVSGGAYLFPRQAASAALDAPFQSDDEAVAAAKAWVVSHFGALQVGTALVATRIDHSASGADAPMQRVTDPGHTIVLHQHYQGTRTSLVSIVHIRGRSTFSGRCEVASFEPLDGSLAPVISGREAVECLVRQAAAAGADEAALEQLRRLASPQLLYLYSPLRDEELDLDPLILDPNWAFGELMVDAYTGKVWRNC